MAEIDIFLKFQLFAFVNFHNKGNDLQFERLALNIFHGELVKIVQEFFRHRVVEQFLNLVQATRLQAHSDDQFVAFLFNGVLENAFKKSFQLGVDGLAGIIVLFLFLLDVSVEPLGQNAVREGGLFFEVEEGAGFKGVEHTLLVIFQVIVHLCDQEGHGGLGMVFVEGLQFGQIVGNFGPVGVDQGQEFLHGDFVEGGVGLIQQQSVVTHGG